MDPLQFDYPQLTPFNYAGNKPITHIDIDGLQSTGDEKRDTHTIVKGDTFWDLAESSEGAYSVDDLKKWNPKDNPRRLQIGQKINISEEAGEKRININLNEIKQTVKIDNTYVESKDVFKNKTVQLIFNNVYILDKSGEIKPADNLTSLEMWLDAPSESVEEGIVKIVANIGYSIVNSPYSLLTGQTIGGTPLNSSEKTDAFVDFVPGLILGGFTKAGEVIKTSKKGLQGFNQFVKRTPGITTTKGLPKGMCWQKRAGQLFQANKVNQKGLKDLDKVRNVLNIVNTTKK